MKQHSHLHLTAEEFLTLIGYALLFAALIAATAL